MYWIVSSLLVVFFFVLYIRSNAVDQLLFFLFYLFKRGPLRWAYILEQRTVRIVDVYPSQCSLTKNNLKMIF